MEHTRTTNRLVGSPVERIEDLRFLRGRGEYVGDLAVDGMLHAVVLRSQVAHGRIRAIDVSAARARPGVHAVITAADLGTVPLIPQRLDVLPTFKPYQQPVLADKKVRYVGEPLALVVADSPALAEDALEAIEVDIEALPAVAGRDAARTDKVSLFDGHSNLTATLTALKGDAVAALRAAPYVRRERFKVHRFTAVPMEARGLLAQWDAAAGKLTVFGAAKIAFPNRRILSALIGLPESAIRMVENDVAADRTAGEMDRGSAREPARLQPCARRRDRACARMRARRDVHRTRGRGVLRFRGLCAHRGRDTGAQHRAGAVGALQRAAHPDRGLAGADQQDAGRDLSGAGAL
jgi:carbon-monoxide dehydrogenase large subunit